MTLHFVVCIAEFCDFVPIGKTVPSASICQSPIETEDEYRMQIVSSTVPETVPHFHHLE